MSRKRAWQGSVYVYLAFPLFFFLFASSLTAQTSATGSLSGTVTDATGAVVPNVTVTATSVGTAQVRTATTGGAGDYKFSLLPPGAYRVKFEAAGFQTVEIPSVTVTVTETGTLNQVLAVGSQSQQVTVQADVQELQTESSALGTVLPSKTITDLPLSTRNYTNLLTLSAGANASVENATAGGKGSVNIATNGAGLQQNAWLQDGAPISNFGGLNQLTEQATQGSIGIPNPDALEEFKIQTSTYDASYGRNPGANVNVITKSGTNDYHGTAFEFFRNTDLNANDFFLKRSGQPRGVLSENQYGGVIGGPIKKDKLFFFGSYQETWQRNGYSIFGYTSGINLAPLPLGNRGTCPLSATSVTGCDAPAQAFAAGVGNNICPANNPNSESLANSQAGISRSNYNLLANAGVAQVNCNGSNLNPIALRILQLKLPNGGYYIPSSGLTAGASGGGYLTTSYSLPALFREHQGNVNVDYEINSKNTLSTRYFYDTDPTNAPIGSVGNSTNDLPGTPILFFYTNTTALVRLTSVLTNNLVNEARLSYQRVSSPQTANPVFSDAQLGITPIQPGFPQFDYWSFMGITGLWTMGVNNAAYESVYVNSFQVADQISWTHGKHTARFGFEGTHELWQWNGIGFLGGQVTFPSLADFLLGLPGCAPGTSAGACSTSGLLGTTTGTSFSGISAIANADRGNAQGDNHYILSHSFNAFGQDDFKVTPRLTLNLGLRWEYNYFLTDKYGALTGVWPNLISTQPTPGSGCVYNNFSWGAGAAGTGCSFAGFVAPANYSAATYGPLPAGVFQNNSNYIEAKQPIWDNFAPRVGYAWQPLSTNKFVVRGGFGYFYERIDGGRTSGYAQLPPYAIALQNTGAALFSSSLASPFPQLPLGWTPRYLNLTSGVSSNLNPGGGGGSIGPSFPTPLVYEYSQNIQYEFRPTWVLELGYVGSHGIHQLTTDPIGGALLASPSAPVDGVTTNSTSNANGPSVRTPYPGFSPAFHLQTTTASFKYNSLQATIRKQFGHGLTMQAAYTWSRAFMTSYVGNPNASFADNVPVVLQYGLNTAYRPQRLVVNYNYALPFGNPSGLKGKLVMGWALSGVTTIQDGTPLTITDSRGGTVFGNPVTSNAECASTCANVATMGSPAQRLGAGNVPGSGYLNPAAFITTPAVSTLAGCTPSVCASGSLYGNSGLGIILGPGQNNWDMSISKITTVGGLREDATLQFRAEFFNTFNHPQFANPAVGVSATSSFGFITASSVNPRLVQFALKYAF